MIDKQLKAALDRAYSKGYRAGEKRKQREISAEVARREEQALLDRAFFAVLPTAMTVQGWSYGTVQITSVSDRIKLAKEWAVSAISGRPLA